MRARMRAALVLTLTGGTLAFVFGLPGVARAAAPAERIAFVQSDGTHDQVWVVNTDGTGLTQLTHDTSNDEIPAWSPDGTRIAYLSDGHLTVMDANGSGERQLSSLTASSGQVSWSPDSAQLAFPGDDPGNGGAPGVWVVGASGGSPVEIIKNAPAKGLSCCGKVLNVAWSPNGGQVAGVIDFLSEGDESRNIVVTNSDGSDPHFLTTSAGPAGVAWSPDGSRIAFSYAVGLSISNPDGSNRFDILPNPPVSEVDSWSPDGGSIVYGSSTSSTQTDLWALSPDGTGDRRLATTGGQDSGAVWSPGGTQVVFTSSLAATSSVYIVNANATGAPTPLAVAGHSPTYAPSIAQRRLGITRIGTAVDISRHTFASAGAVVVARADDYPDALSGAPLAKKVGGPLLLSDTDALPPEVGAEVQRLGATTAYILGSDDALSPNVEAGLAAAGVTTIHRLGGADRYATAALVANQVGGTSAYVAEGFDPDPSRGWPDAISVSALAAFQQRPILLTLTDSLPTPTSQALQNLGTTQATIIGGSDVVSDGVAQQIASQGGGITVNRLAGADRYGTSVAVADAAAGAGMSNTTPWFAIGNNWPDGLATGPAAAATGSNFVLIDGSSLSNSPASQGWITPGHGAGFTAATFSGGPDVLSLRDLVAVLRTAGAA